MIYLDHNATTPVRPEAVEAMAQMWADNFGNPSSTHQVGQRARRALEAARVQAASLLGETRSSRIIFTSGGTEGNVLAIRGTISALARSGRPGRHILASPVEHDSALACLEDLESEGYEVERLHVDRDGAIEPQEVSRNMRPDTRLVVAMAANNEIGTIQPTAEIGRYCREAGVAFHVDAVQAAGRIPLSVGALGCTTLTVSGHKIGAPKGIGALWIDPGLALVAISPGHQEDGRRAGTENVAGAVGFGAAAQAAAGELQQAAARWRALRDYWEGRLEGGIPDLRINGRGAGRVANTSHCSIAGVRAVELLIALDLEGVAVSVGSACAAGVAGNSSVVSAIGLEEPWKSGSIRVSFGRSTTREELEAAAGILEGCVTRLRRVNRQSSQPQLSSKLLK